jgi:hypothetical protein
MNSFICAFPTFLPVLQNAMPNKIPPTNVLVLKYQIESVDRDERVRGVLIIMVEIGLRNKQEVD